jgi:hypothetical protein
VHFSNYELDGFGFDSYRPCECYGDVRLVAIVCRNGARQYRLECLICGQRGLGTIPHRLVLENWREYVEDVQVNPRATYPACVRCGRTDYTENHHWAPRGIFKECDESGLPEAEHWPQSPLCRDCHMYWHAWMQTPGAPPIHRVTRPPIIRPYGWEFAETLSRWDETMRIYRALDGG